MDVTGQGPPPQRESIQAGVENETWTGMINPRRQFRIGTCPAIGGVAEKPTCPANLSTTPPTTTEKLTFGLRGRGERPKSGIPQQSSVDNPPSVRTS